MSVSDQSWRQIALCAWGSQYLAGHDDLEDWFRHGVFWNAPQLFRAFPGRELIATDFAAWLYWLRARGATRLSLHALAPVDAPAGNEIYWGKRWICVHFPQGCERWLSGEEEPSCREANEAAKNTARQATGRGHWIPDPAVYAGEIDTWWCLGTGEAVTLPKTDWPATAARVKAELFPEEGLRGEWRLPARARLLAGNRGDAEWSRLPTLPPLKDQAGGSPLLPHRLLAYLDNEEARFDNDTHCKNENSLYAFASDEETARISRWGQNLNDWLDTLQLAAANELHWEENTTGGAVLSIPGTEPAGEAQLQPDADTSATAAQALPQVGGAEPASSGRGIPALLIDGIVLVVLCVVIVALARVLGRYEWLSVLIALPWMLYIRKK